jgi:hypothetical protein
VIILSLQIPGCKLKKGDTYIEIVAVWKGKGLTAPIENHEIIKYLI